MMKTSLMKADPLTADSVGCPVLRFAPSPNGRLHLGHAFSALFTERAAADLGGVWLLRIEDIDPVRSKEDYVAGIREDLAWLGLKWPEPAMRQSARMAAYAAAAEGLRARRLLYPCFCSRRDIAARATATDPDGAPLYAGTCRHLTPVEVHRRLENGEPVQWRLKMDRAASEAGPVEITEAPAPRLQAFWAEASRRSADPAVWGDAVLIRKDTPASYHLSVVVDDAAQGVTHVTRGMDLFAATSLHALLQRLLGLGSPLYAHHTLLLDRDGQKLSKSKSAPSLRSLAEQGWSAADVRKHLGVD
jgi:glutamyl-Q tRNA(Asp) synthetase